MEYSTAALGTVIRTRREALAPKLSQAKLGEKAGYGAGAGVSISRIERGESRPSPEKLEGIAAALGVTAEMLERAAARLTRDSVRQDGAGGAADSGSGGKAEPLKRRVEKLQRMAADRTAKIDSLVDAFNTAHDDARDEFFIPFLRDARRIVGAPEPPEPEGLTDEDSPEATYDESADPAATAQQRLWLSSSGVAKALEDKPWLAKTFGGVGGGTVGAGVGTAAAYGAFTAVAAFGTASTGAAIGSLSGAAATSAALAWFGGGAVAAGGAGVAGGAVALGAIAAAPVAVLAVGGFLLMARRSKQKEAERRKKVAEAEADLAATQPGFDALCESLAAATDVLGYIAVHCAHAHKRWSRELASFDSVPWAELTSGQQQRYQDFVTVAACQLTVANLNASAFITSRDNDLKTLVSRARQDIEHARRTVESIA